MTVKEHLVKELESLDERQLHEVEDYVIFVKLRPRLISSPPFNEEQVAKLYGEFAEEDRLLAEEGIENYTNTLTKEDKR